MRLASVKKQLFISALVFPAFDPVVSSNVEVAFFLGLCLLCLVDRGNRDSLLLLAQSALDVTVAALPELARPSKALLAKVRQFHYAIWQGAARATRAEGEEAGL